MRFEEAAILLGMAVRWVQCRIIAARSCDHGGMKHGNIELWLLFLRWHMNKLVLVIALCWLALPRLVAAGESNFGERTVAQLPASDFFKFFSLTRVGEQTAPNTKDTYIVYGTPGQFSGQVFVLVKVGKDGQMIESMLAAITRSFIDTPATSTFARDFAKSFIQFATPAEARSGVSGLVREIWTGVSPGMTRYVKHGSTLDRITPEQSTQASDAYRTFMGNQQKATVTLPDDWEITLQNGAEPGKQPTLTIAVESHHS
ncbi:hypothetical protein IHE49_10855 [Rhodanobacter sp. 7MK24]|uniref:hypothetical protein n=1 Tax=Rhodanobacter sp. 7MK24 TaxID=2775922 RepID=UPI001786B848|nr:hypothetical protein [Rhodanobacter sp. 7MK24]MBD8880977.1 hypothetical protein [Rhodanobacter sp. 7MK24]